MFFARTSYEGKHTADGKRMHGHGAFTFASGDTYVGMFHDGAFHGQGVVFYTAKNGGGQFRGLWDCGTLVRGDYVFCDGLEFAEKDWSHCTPSDRRLWHEVLTFVAPPTAASGAGGGGADTVTVTPDYATTDGVPPAFSHGKPRAATDVSANFWRSAPNPPAEFSGPASLTAKPQVGGATTPADGVTLDMQTPMAEVIAAACPRVSSKADALRR